MPERLDFWGIPTPWGSAIVYASLACASIFMIVRFYLNARYWWRVGRREVRWDKPMQRIGRVFQYYLGQSKVLSQTYPGYMHLAIFGSMVVFFLGTALATINGHFFVILQGNVYFAYKLILDLFIPVFLVGAGMAAYRRWVTRPERLTMESKFTWTLILLTFIVVLGPVIESLRLAVEKPAWAAWSPIGWGIAQLWISLGLSEATLHGIHQSVYALHVLGVVVLFVTVPTGTLLHVVTSALNIFFSKLDRPTGQLAPIPATAQGESIYADRLSHLTWKQLLDASSCTECGRCQDACPAHAAGRSLSPKKLILSLRSAFEAGKANAVKGQAESKALVGDWITADVLWSCTTCGACVAECPVLIEHVDSIVDMRRYLISESRLDDKLKEVLVRMERYGNSFGQSERARSKWTTPIQPKIKDARKEEVEYLWFVGDYASFDPALVDTTRKTAEVFQKAGLNFGILYEAERNSGNDIRRVGEEGLFEFLVEKNNAAFQKSKFQKIVTTDPHTYNTLKNEYPKEMMAGHEVVHYTELLDQLITNGQLKLSKPLGYKVTYHDPCYLGRYNQVFEAPRRVIAATGCEIVEMPRCRANSFCCGAGGGQIWIQEQSSGERPSENRIREAIQLQGVNQFIVACPKDLAMYRDAVKTTSQEERIVVKDLIDLIYEAL
jgi:Fe-S oxidoreductase